MGWKLSRPCGYRYDLEFFGYMPVIPIGYHQGYRRQSTRGERHRGVKRAGEIVRNDDDTFHPCQAADFCRDSNSSIHPMICRRSSAVSAMSGGRTRSHPF